MTDDVVPSSPAIFRILPFDCLSLIFIIASANVLRLFCFVTITNVLNYSRQEHVGVCGLTSNGNKLQVNINSSKVSPFFKIYFHKYSQRF